MSSHTILRRPLFLVPFAAVLLVLFTVPVWWSLFAYENGYTILSSHHPLHRSSRSPAGGAGYTYSEWAKRKRWSWLPGSEYRPTVYVTAYAELSDHTTVIGETLFVLKAPNEWPPTGDILDESFEEHLGARVDQRNEPPWYTVELISRLLSKSPGA